MKRRDTLLALAIAAAFALAVLLAGGSEASSTPGGPGRFASARYGFSVPVPSGWHRSRSRLVPRLLDPREVVSLGTFGMRVGGGGDCGREPAAALRAMRPGDALVTIQEVAVFRSLRRRLTHNFPPRPPSFDLGPGSRVWLGGRTYGPIRHAKLVFSDHGRAFEALAYVDGVRPELRREIEAILAGLRVKPGSWARYHGDEATSPG